jgi:hypothetical protein
MVRGSKNDPQPVASEMELQIAAILFVASVCAKQSAAALFFVGLSSLLQFLLASGSG